MKYCRECGCNMSDDHDGVVCECCLDERGDTVPDGLGKDVESLYPKIILTTSGPVRETLNKILESKLSNSVDRSKVNPVLFRGYGRLINER